MHVDRYCSSLYPASVACLPATTSTCLSRQPLCLLSYARCIPSSPAMSLSRSRFPCIASPPTKLCWTQLLWRAWLGCCLLWSVSVRPAAGQSTGSEWVNGSDSDYNIGDEDNGSSNGTAAAEPSYDWGDLNSDDATAISTDLRVGWQIRARICCENDVGECVAAPTAIQYNDVVSGQFGQQTVYESITYSVATQQLGPNIVAVKSSFTTAASKAHAYLQVVLAQPGSLSISGTYVCGSTSTPFSRFATWKYPTSNPAPTYQVKELQEVDLTVKPPVIRFGGQSTWSGVQDTYTWFLGGIQIVHQPSTRYVIAQAPGGSEVQYTLYVFPDESFDRFHGTSMKVLDPTTSAVGGGSPVSPQYDDYPWQPLYPCVYDGTLLRTTVSVTDNSSFTTYLLGSAYQQKLQGGTVPLSAMDWSVVSTAIPTADNSWQLTAASTYSTDGYNDPQPFRWNGIVQQQPVGLTIGTAPVPGSPRCWCTPNAGCTQVAAEADDGSSQAGGAY